ncbi:hypothetical protein V6N13_074303 [Hibiscus sabdariffa]|uniref:Uncharacterized protein n=2 Tax=Hibiscus sabdariffa TaxID=183260 RepID=A0ABR1ZEX9_9ROSI
MGGRLQSVSSLVFNTESTSLVDETTTVGTWPSFRYIIGPNLVDRPRRDKWGLGPRRWWRLPMMGNLGGDGGRLGFVLVEVCLNRSFKRRRSKMDDANSRKEGLMGSSCKLGREAIGEVQWQLESKHKREGLPSLFPG